MRKYSKSTVLIALMLVISGFIHAQGVAINTDGESADASSMLDVKATNKGLLVPRISIPNLSSAAPVLTPAVSLLVYNTNTTTGVGYYYWNGSVWVKLFTAADVHAPKWSGNNNTTDAIGRTGNVGIGTASPEQKLEVAGIIEVDNPASGVLAYFKGGSDDTAYEWAGFYSGETRQGIILWDGAWAGAGNRTNEFSITAENSNWLTLTSATGTSILGGNVGINTSSPLNKLHVAGATRIVAQGSGWEDHLNLYSNDGTNRWNILVDNGASDIFRLAYNGGSIPDVIAATTTGNVGIGTVGPSQKLQVNGNIKLDDNMMVEGVSSYRVYRNLATYDNSTNAAAGAFVITTSQPWNSACMFRVKIEGYFYDATSPFEMIIGGYMYSNNSFYNYGYINNGAKRLVVRFARNISTNTVAIIIGSEGDSYSYPKLTITTFMQGHSSINEAYADGWTIAQYTSLANFDYITTVPDVTTLPSGSNNYIQNQTAVNQPASFRISGSGYLAGSVGIGTISPAYKLDVVGDIRSSGEHIGTLSTGSGQFRAISGSYGAFIRNDGTDTYIPLLTASGNQYGSWNSLRPLRISNSTGDLHFVNGLVYMRHNDGYLGIGTTSPAEKLHVIGNTRISSLAGTGYRPVYADPDGTLTISAPGTVAGAATIVPLATFYGEPFINSTSWQRLTRTTYTPIANLFSGVVVPAGATRKYYLVIRKADNQPGGTGSYWRFSCDGAWNGGSDVQGHGFSLASDWGNLSEGTTHWIEIPPTAVSGSGAGTQYWKLDARMANAGQSMRVMSVSIAAIDVYNGTNIAYAAATAGTATSPLMSTLYENIWATGTNGNVGIGTSAPTEKLVVNGKARSGALNDILYVDGLYYTTIQAAINALPATGGKVVIPEGTWILSSAINISGKSNIIIEGVGPSTIITSAAGSNFNLFYVYQSSNISIRDMSIVSPDRTQFNNIGVYIYESRNCLIENCYIKDCNYGVYLHHGDNVLNPTANNLIQSNKLYQCYTGIRLYSSKYCAETDVETSQVKYNIITDNNIDCNSITGSSGIYSEWYGYNNVFSGNIINKPVSYGIQLAYTYAVTVEGNTISAPTSYGIHEQGAHYSSFTENKIINSTSTSGEGIKLLLGNHQIVSNNVVSSSNYNVTGIDIGGSYITISGNTVQNFNRGYWISATYSTIMNNVHRMVSAASGTNGFYITGGNCTVVGNRSNRTNSIASAGGYLAGNAP